MNYHTGTTLTTVLDLYKQLESYLLAYTNQEIQYYEIDKYSLSFRLVNNNPAWLPFCENDEPRWLFTDSFIFSLAAGAEADLRYYRKLETILAETSVSRYRKMQLLLVA